MRLGILAVGHKLPDWVAKGCAEYVKRMPRELPLDAALALAQDPAWLQHAAAHSGLLAGQ